MVARIGTLMIVSEKEERTESNTVSYLSAVFHRSTERCRRNDWSLVRQLD